MRIDKKYLIASLIILLAVFVAYKMYNKPHVSVQDSRAEISLDASKIINDFLSDEDKANTTYLEKIIEIKGTLKEIKTENSKTILILGTSGEIENVMCNFENSENIEFKNLSIGNTITVKGICTGYLLDVILVKCLIVK